MVSTPASERGSGELPPLLRLPPTLLDRILAFSLLPPHPVQPSTPLNICRVLRQRALRLVFADLDLAKRSSLAARDCLDHLDPLFGHRLQEYTSTPSYLPFFDHSHPPKSFYPLTPDNALSLQSWAAAAFRHHVRTLRVLGYWSGPTFHPTWTRAHQGVPFAAIPILLDVARRSFIGLQTLTLDLPKSLRAGGSVVQGEVLRAGRDSLRALHGYHNLLGLALDVWVLPGPDLAGILQHCESLEVLHVRRAVLSDAICAPAAFSSHFGTRLRRLTLTAPSIQFSAIPALLMTFPCLQSLQITGFTHETTDVSLGDFVARCVPRPSRRRFPNLPPFAPLQSLILRPSYSIPFIPTPDRIVQIVALLLAVSPTLRHLHLGIQFLDTAALLPLLSSHFDALERLWIGFMSAQDEIGEGTRLTVGDDRRCRPGAGRGAFEADDVDPLPVGPVERWTGWVPPLTTQQASRMPRSMGFTEQAVLARLRLDSDIARRLVDPHLRPTPPWPPTSLPAHNRLISLLAPHHAPYTTEIFARPRTRTLRAFFVFETELVGACGRSRASVLAAGGGGPKWIAPGVKAPDPADVAWAMVMASRQGR